MAAVWLLTVPVPWCLAALAAATVHELGHVIWMRAEGIPVWGVEIGAVGARIETGRMEPGEELRCALAGPAAGLMLCLGWRILPKTAFCALIQSVYNLLPLGTMDGGRILRCTREIREKRGNPEKSVANGGVSEYNDSD